MKLNPDCIRDILFVVEDLANGKQGVGFDFEAPCPYERLSKYSNDEIEYHVHQCEYAGYFTRVVWVLSGDCTIFDLSPAGHQFIADIRSDTVWNTVKSKAAKVGSYSLSVITQITATVIAELINAQFRK